MPLLDIVKRELRPKASATKCINKLTDNLHSTSHLIKMQMNICLRDLPTRKISTLPSRVPTHAYADCKISGQQPTQLYKEFPRVHEVGH